MLQVKKKRQVNPGRLDIRLICIFQPFARVQAGEGLLWQVKKRQANFGKFKKWQVNLAGLVFTIDRLKTLHILEFCKATGMLRISCVFRN